MMDAGVKCQLLDPSSVKEGEEHFKFVHADNSAVSKNELAKESIDIGQIPWGYKYPASKKSFMWKLENYTPDISSRYWQRRCFNSMFHTIQLIIPRKFKSVRQNTDKADFRIRMIDDIQVFDGLESVLAHAVLYHPHNAPEDNGLMEWNDSPESRHYFTPFGDPLPAYLVDGKNYHEGEQSPDGNLKTLATQPMLSIGMHELKHNMGYRHNCLDKNSLMYPYVRKGYESVYDYNTKKITYTVNPAAFIWTDSDIQRWHEGYGKRNIARRWLDYFRARRLRGRFVKGIPYRVI